MNDCEADAVAKGLCNPHYQRQRRWGDPAFVPSRSRSPYERLMERVERQGSCLVFTGSTVGNGYGVIGADGKQVLVHRLSYEVHHGEIPAKAEVMHICDNPPCIEPSHLKIGTHAENMDDMNLKGRHHRGANKASRVNESQVKEMRELHKQGESVAEVARLYELPYMTASHILKNRTWRHVT